jgi:hypothetical protein
VGCGGGGSGTATATGGGPGGPFEGQGAPGMFATGKNQNDPFATFGNGGPFEGQGAPGPFANSNSSGGGCAALCTRFAAFPCPQDGPQGGGGSRQEPAQSTSCNCLDEQASHQNDCERFLFAAFVTCRLSADLSCRNGRVQAASCHEPDYSVCGGRVVPDMTNDQPPTVVDGGPR